jgi:hypothetical protein
MKVGAMLPAAQRHDVEQSARLISYLTSNPEISTSLEKHRSEIARSNGLQDALALIVGFLNRRISDA